MSVLRQRVIGEPPTQAVLMLTDKQWAELQRTLGLVADKEEKPDACYR